jgi:putative spermidine/putrescine transport system ATP-binding protein
MSTISFGGVAKSFGATIALSEFHLDVESGELISLLGPSGCGKTTALRILAGFERADHGMVCVAGADITDLPAHKRSMGMVFQSYSLFPNLTVAENVEYGLRTRRIAKDKRRRTVSDMLDLVELSTMAHRYPHQLSGGQQQRVALARALAVQPQVLLLDEPLSALDAKVRLSLRDEIRRIQRELGITTLFVTHDQEEALGISDRVGVMSNGRLEQLGAPSEVYRNPANAFVARFVGSMNEIRAVGVDEHRVRVAGITVPAANSIAPGADLHLLVRPEDVGLGAPVDHGLVGSVVGQTFQGASTLVTVRVDVLDALITVHAAGSTADTLSPGARVGLEFRTEHAICEPVD